ncbi:hypothetical protein KPSA1_00452 [Pseudomonas syringae pv. actinidiae]|uniref:Uncharacterized protein n=1 Tax=Pseudomonas syringae pv. actinidiae TaxID=103796 RepID=A0A2V0Q3T0_PSESF|nr:hypothetical protein KPSA1_00452 [Pseudomonas syringae pv. actinidiae]
MLIVRHKTSYLNSGRCHKPPPCHRHKWKSVFQTSKRPDKSKRLPEHFRGAHVGAAPEMFNYNMAPVA